MVKKLEDGHNVHEDRAVIPQKYIRINVGIKGLYAHRKKSHGK